MQTWSIDLKMNAHYFIHCLGMATMKNIIFASFDWSEFVYITDQAEHSCSIIYGFWRMTDTSEIQL